jgi:putative Mg2+ transporter-C (MgtC) family protein
MVQAILDWLLSDTNIRLFSAAFLGTAIGLERELSGKDPSLRTFSLISLGSCLFTLASVESVSASGMHGDPSRIAAQIVSGIGFIGAGVIFKSKNRVHGLTTAALMWMTAAIGMCVGIGRVDIAFSGTIIGLVVIVALRAVHEILNRIEGAWQRPEDPDNNRIE